MFRGVNGITLDAKGRISIPARYKQSLLEKSNGMLVATIDTEELCLLLYPLPEWEQIEQKIETLPSFNRTARRIQRLLLGYATELDMDSHGRILLPPLLREYAHLEKQAVLIGQGKKFELWDEAQWTKRRDIWLEEEQHRDVESIPEELKKLSL